MQYPRILFALIFTSTLLWTPALAHLSSHAHTTGADSGRGVASVRGDHPRPRIGRKSPGRATVYSTAGTLLLAPVFGGGLIVGPSFGHFYANNPRQALTGIGLRTAGATAFLVALDDAVGANASEGAEAVTVMGLVTVLCSAVYDIGTADDAVRTYNDHDRRQVRVRPAAGRNGQIGLALRVQL